MPEIFLRAYERKIDELIEREKLEEAIAHCRHILQTYPKHLDTYRHLGKAYLEAKRYGDAADIFQRVLSAVPDDFVSHIGMAIVREDEGNLDAAIWHMERAFETNPSNPAIQQEMKRLIGRRDGLEPHKVRLTRGALARMYAHGELFSQAIAELRSALQEDPERPDLQVLLARMYWQTDQKSDATTVSNQIIEKLPYCEEANRILAANLQAGERVEEAAVYHRRLANLDPYAAFVESALIDASSVEDEAISIEKLEWQPGEAVPVTATGQPGWAATLGMEMQEPKGEADEQAKPPQTGPLPSWLEPGEPPPFEAAAAQELRDEVEKAEGSEDPESDAADFMTDDEELGPEEPIQDQAEPEGIPPASVAAAAGLAAGLLGGNDEEPGDDALAVGAAAEADQPSESGSEIPNWMQEAGWGESTGEAVDSPVSFSDQEMSSLDAGEIPAETPADGHENDADLAPAELPDWVQDIAHDEARPGSGPEADGTGELPDWLAGDKSDEPPVDFAPSETDDVGLEPTTEEPGGESETESAFPAAQADTSNLPTWITEDSPGASETIVTWLEDRGTDDEEETEAGDEEVPEWMQDTGKLEQPLELTEEAPTYDDPHSPDVAEVPQSGVEDAAPVEGGTAGGWLSAVAAVAAQEEAGEAEQAKAEAAELPDATPDWLTDPAEQPGEADIDLDIPAIVDEPTDEGHGPVADSQEPEITELEPAEDMPTPPSPPIAGRDGTGTPAPEWIEKIETAQDATDGAEWVADLGEDIEEPVAAAPADTPDWLKGLADEGSAADEQGGSRAADAPDWLRQIADPESAAAEDSEEIPQGAEWLEGVVDEQVEPAQAPDAPEVDAEETIEPTQAPDWLTGVPDEEQPLASEVEVEPEKVAVEAPAPAPAEEDDEVMEWLESLAEKQVKEAEDESVVAPSAQAADTPMVEERGLPEEPEEGMEWLEQLADQRGLDVDVGMPSEVVAEPETVQSAPAEVPEIAEPEPETVLAPPPAEVTDTTAPEEDSAPGTAPDWLTRMATQPLPKVDLEALEAAASEVAAEFGSDDETVETSVDDIVSPRDETIEARAGDLESELEAEPETDEIPDWLVAAAAQGDSPAAATTLPSRPQVEDAPAEGEAEELLPEIEPADEIVLEAEAEMIEHAGEPAERETDLDVDEGLLPEPEPSEPHADLEPEMEVEEAEEVEAAEPEPVEATAAPEPEPKGKGPEAMLEKSRLALASGDIDGAIGLYGDLIKRKQSLDSIIEDLRLALERDPESAALWQSLGDAYMRDDQTDEAIDAYRKGMEAA